jgi:hypothetical protein
MDVEAALAELEARLRALQAELSVSDEVVGVQASTTAVRESLGPGGVPVDALEAFGEELRRLTRELVDAFDRAYAGARGLSAGSGILFRGEVAVDAVVDFAGLCALGRALSSTAGVVSVDLRAYAGGRAALDLVLDRPVALVSELHRTLRHPLAVVEAREGRLAIEVGVEVE